MICFHFTIFVVLETTNWQAWRDQAVLWFAFILLSLSYWKQPQLFPLTTPLCCDLLSFYYLCRTGNNNRPADVCASDVVICFHFTIFVVLETTVWRATLSPLTLWFAFILLSLSYWKQLHLEYGVTRGVVICFHFTIFVVLETTSTGSGGLLPRCDLLSFYYLCRTGNNERVSKSPAPGVVICFHFTIFVVLETTRASSTPLRWTLWFAFILLSLSYWKQRFALECRKYGVVICFHFTIFVVLETT